MIKTLSVILSTLIFTCAIAGPSFAAGSAEERADCMSDALSICGQFVPSEKAITACMIKNKAKLSPACRRHFK